MDILPSLKKDWSLTREAFDKLLLSLNPDRERAAEKYEKVRRRLITFFECRGCTAPEDCADMTINRVARRISEGVEIYASDPSSFFFGVARKVLQEYWDELSKHYAPIEDVPQAKFPVEDPAEVKMREAEQSLLMEQIDCLERCLEKLSDKNRELIRRYYQGETGVKIMNRKRLAEKLGIQMNALRIRALRIREKLEQCVNDCCKQQLRGT